MKGTAILNGILPRRIVLNPIVVKELRQAVRSNYVVGVLFLFLLVQLVATVVALLTTSTASIVNLSQAFRAGRDMFSALIAILSGACLLFIPTYAGVRLSMERQAESMDLLFVTAIRPAAIIRGKLFASATITLLIFSAAAPFMSFTYLLRGIDLPSVFVVLVFNFFVILVAVEAAMLLACIPASKPFKGLLGLAFFGGMLASIGSLAYLSNEMITEGIGSRLGLWDFWQAALAVCGMMFTVAGMFHVLSVAMISPSSANRALPVRIFVTLVWLAWGAAFVGTSISDGDPDALIPWMVASTFLACCALLAVVSESPAPGPRIRLTIPKTRVLQWLALLFYTGPVGGLAWVMLIMFMTLGISRWCTSYIGGPGVPSYASPNDAAAVLTGVFLYLVAYAMAALLFCRTFLKRRPWHKITWSVTLLLIAAGSILPVIVAFVLSKIRWDSATGDEWYFLGNMFALVSARARPRYLQFVAVCAIVLSLCNLKWFMQQAKNFAPFDNGRLEPPAGGNRGRNAS